MTAPPTPASPAQAAATVSEAEVEAFCLAFYGDCGGAPLLPGTLDRIRAGIAAARERAPVQGSEAQPVAWRPLRDAPLDGTPVWMNAPGEPVIALWLERYRRWVSLDGGFINYGVTEWLPIAPPDAPRPDIEAARREERERCARHLEYEAGAMSRPLSDYAAGYHDCLIDTAKGLRAGDRP